MAPVPKKKHTRSRSSIRRGPKKAILPKLSRCPSCNSLKESHRACPSCGHHHTDKA
ncbi:50S ribosomal protein L32 [Patescibacteria group bacterium]|nr:50S ribosomal protein L32 [Patescibacteria group bacterium]MBU0777086.1 50S ribosomal protein L32 [Patescibacteria group bacterium]MBU0845780.1 50S ribosomal protein L32 [Patescibacteria group bacterium]MBU0922807.1 50S ribosomal protein L32 [Patescibacteria group bacterium]MBU1066460.1 50S ribosomal protein L32 [Patescibacteria group bacterium]